MQRTGSSGFECSRGNWPLVRLLPKVHAPLTIVALTLSIVQSLATAASIVSTGVVVGALPGAVRTGLNSPTGGRLFVAMAVGAAAVWLLYVLPPFQAAVADTLGRKLDGSLQQRIMRATCTPAGVAHLEDPEVLDRVRDAEAVGEGQFTPGAAVRGLVSAVDYRLASLAGAILVGQFKWWLGVWILASSVLLRRRMTADGVAAAGGAGATQDLRRADYLRSLALAPEAAKELRLFRLSPWVLQRFAAHWLSGMDAVWEHRQRCLRGGWPWVMPWAASIVTSLYLAAQATIDGRLSLGSVAIVTQAAISASFVWFGADDVRVAHAVASINAVEDLEQMLCARSRQHGGTAAAPGAVADGIRFDNVSFRYPGQQADVLSNLDLFIPAGRSLAIVGGNGAGKTTLLKLLTRLYDPTSGHITVDGARLDQMDAKAWQRKVSCIFQDFVRFELTVADNVAFGALEHAGDGVAMDDAVGSIGGAAFIAELPNGWDTPLSRQYRGGADLSGGEWQRIALGRALFAVHGGAQVLVLDEPTANLDPRAEAELFDRFLAITKGVTTVVISHRFSSVRRADAVCVLANGRVAEMGTHEELIVAGGSYEAMFGLQAGRFSLPAGALDNGPLVDSLTSKAHVA